MAQQIERRIVVGALGAAALSLALPRGLRAEPSLTAALAELFGNLDSARHIGRAYLRQTPAEASRETLLSALDGTLPSAAKGEELRRQLRQDFADGNVVTVRGWLLSRTEARLCGLAALA